ncbi:hypothetical protein Cgig2_022121 [Carnegiea gigantea]|uniref:PPM-type phosphatase domain-containing protein n=1 Tax=Carnegiea gigantea TaxID=171969 RepID=A0A9Q1K1B5_9CARY|nr:hypothetical protein Cgig2_022121 [Carnegiea gigantea]
MRFKDIRLKFQNTQMVFIDGFLAVLRLNALLKGADNGVDEREVIGKVKKPSWMMPISHGYHVVDGQSWREESNGLEHPDNVVVQREEMANLELWFYGISDARVGDEIAKYMQSHFFDKKLFKESEIRKKSKETMRKAYLNTRAKHKDNSKSDMLLNGGSASAMVINGEKLVVAQIGEHKVVVCRDGIAHQLRSRHQHKGKRHWPRRLISGFSFLLFNHGSTSGAMRIPKARMQACHTGSESGRKQMKNSELVVASENIDSETEFIILASTGVWEVMRKQEAVDLIRHIDDPQEAAKCLAREALSRMSKSNISCLVIRFD